MKKLFVFLILLFTTPAIAGFLGEKEQGEDIYIWSQINNSDGDAATSATSVHLSIWDHDDASAPTASGNMVEWDLGNAPGLFRYLYKPSVGLLATGECVARIDADVTSRTPAGIHTFFVVDSGKGPNNRSTLTTSSAIGSVTGAVGSVTGAVGSVTAGVTVTTNNDKTGYGLGTTDRDTLSDIEASVSTVSRQVDDLESSMELVAGSGFDTSTDSLEAIRDRGDTAWITGGTSSTLADNLTNRAIIATSMRSVNVSTVETTYGSIVQKLDQTNASISTIEGYTDGDGSGGIDADINTIDGYVDVLPATAPQSWDDTNDPDDIYNWITGDNHRDLVADSMRTVNVATKESVEGSMVDKLDDMSSSVSTVASGTDLNDTSANQNVIATAMRTVNVASTESVEGSIVDKIDSAGATIETVNATLPTVRSEIRENRTTIMKYR